MNPNEMLALLKLLSSLYATVDGLEKKNAQLTAQLAELTETTQRARRK